MSWDEEFIYIAEWALQNLDLKYRYTFSKNAAKLKDTPGLANCLETAVVISIYEAAVGKGFSVNETIGYEVSYPESMQKADLAFKASKNQRSWSFVEVKKYKTRGGKASIAADIEKLKNAGRSIESWMFIYRFKQSNNLTALLEKNFSQELSIRHQASFSSINVHGNETECELCLCKVK